MNAILEEYKETMKIGSIEGSSGIRDLNTLCEAIGYRENGFRYGSSLEIFLQDNPGCVQAIYDWIDENMVDEWEEYLESELPEEEED